MELALERPKELFLPKLEKTRECTYDKLKLSLQSAKLNFLKQSLRDRGIEFDETIEDIKEFQKSVIKKLNPATRKEINKALLEFSLEMEGTINGLQAGSTTKFQEILKGFGNAGKRTTKTAILGMAATTVLKYVPSIEMKAIAGVAIGTGIVLKGSKNYINNKRKERADAYNNILSDLEIKKDENGNIVDTRPSENVQNVIKDFLSNNNVSFDRDDYIDIREKMYKLNNKDKRKLINIINNMTGNEIDVDARVKDLERPFWQGVRDDFLKPTLAGVISAIGTATAINAIDPVIIAGPVNGFLIKYLFDKIDKIDKTNPIVKAIMQVINWVPGGEWMVSMLGGVITTEIIGKFETGENVFATENIILAAAAGTIYGIARAVGKKVYKGAEGTKEKMERLAERKEIQRIDRELYPEGRKIPKNEEIIVNILKEYMRQEGMEICGEGKTAEDFKKTISNLEKDEQRKIYSVLKQLEKISVKDRMTTKDKLLKIAKGVFWIGATGIATAGVIDIAKPGTIQGLLDKIFGKEENVVEIVQPLPSRGEIPPPNAPTATPNPEEVGKITEGVTDKVSATAPPEETIAPMDTVPPGEPFTPIKTPPPAEALIPPEVIETENAAKLATATESGLDTIIDGAEKSDIPLSETPPPPAEALIPAEVIEAEQIKPSDMVAPTPTPTPTPSPTQNVNSGVKTTKTPSTTIKPPDDIER